MSCVCSYSVQFDIHNPHSTQLISLSSSTIHVAATALRVKASKLLETIWLPYYASKYEQDFFGKPTEIVVDHVRGCSYIT